MFEDIAKLSPIQALYRAKMQNGVSPSALKGMIEYIERVDTVPISVATYFINLHESLRARLMSEKYFMAHLVKNPIYYHAEVKRLALHDAGQYPPVTMTKRLGTISKHTFPLDHQLTMNKTICPVFATSDMYVLFIELLKIDPTRLVIAGGSVLNYVGICEEVNDIDVFMIGDADPLKIIDAIYALFIMNQEFTVQMSSNAYTFVGTSRELPVKIQLIRSVFVSVEQVLDIFDLDSCSIGLMYVDKKLTIALTERFRLALESRTNIVRPDKRDANYIQRLVKYSKRGFAPYFPCGLQGLELQVMSGLIGPLNKLPRGTLAELVYAMTHDDYLCEPSGYNSHASMIFKHGGCIINKPKSIILMGKKNTIAIGSNEVDSTLECLNTTDEVYKLFLFAIHANNNRPLRHVDNYLRTLSEGIIKTDFYVPVVNAIEDIRYLF
jgi:hypothetical protein